jgi:soluble lytic murein transglycosylase-like protein
MIPDKWRQAFDLYRTIIECECVLHEVSPAIVCGIISQESSWKPDAERYEPAFRKRYVEKTYPNATEQRKIELSTSYGLMQTMGLVYCELGFSAGTILDMKKPWIGIGVGTLKLSRLFTRYGAGKDAVAAYNAGSPRRTETGEYVNQSYVDKVFGYSEQFDALLREKK